MDRHRRNHSLFNVCSRKLRRGGALYGALLLFGFRLAANEPIKNSPWDVRLDIEAAETIPFLTLGPAEGLASKMLATAGVRLHWNFGRPHQTDSEAGCSTAPLSIKLLFSSTDVKRAKNSKRLGYTYPYDKDDRRIVIAYDELPPEMRNSVRMSSVVLAHIIVHEITHILQRIDRHSDSGVMKAQWTLADYSNMQTNPLPFKSEDLVLIELGRRSWARLLCGATRSSSDTATPNLEH